MNLSPNDEKGMSLKTILLSFVAIKILLHLYVSLFAGYEIFRDELYYLACADYLAFGYVDHPPLSIWLLKAGTAVFGDSLFAIRLFPALFGGATLYMVGLIVLEMGGRRFALIISCLAYLIAPIHLAFNSIFSMNSIDLFIWSLLYYFTIHLVKSPNRKYWILLGVVLGLGLLNKISVLWAGVGLLAGILLTPNRKWLKTFSPYLAALIALALFSPFIIWNVVNGWPHIEFIQNASGSKYSGLSILSFLSGQLLLNHPSNLILLVGGILFLMRSKALKEYRMTGWMFVVTLLILALNGNSKSEYLAASLSIVYASAGLMIENWKWAMNRKAIQVTMAVILIGGFFVAPLAMPILSEEAFVSYTTTLGFSKSNDEGKEEAELPQFYADMHGWKTYAEAMAAAYHSLPEQEKANAYIFGSNYGRCGAVDYYSEELSIPKSIGSHNNYWLWGRRGYEGGVLIVMSDNQEQLEEIFESVELFSEYRCDYCMPYEDNQKIFIVRGLKIPVDELWGQIKNYS